MQLASNGLEKFCLQTESQLVLIQKTSVLYMVIQKQIAPVVSTLRWPCSVVSDVISMMIMIKKRVELAVA